MGEQPTIYTDLLQHKQEQCSSHAMLCRAAGFERPTLAPSHVCPFPGTGWQQSAAQCIASQGAAAHTPAPAALADYLSAMNLPGRQRQGRVRCPVQGHMELRLARTRLLCAGAGGVKAGSVSGVVLLSKRPPKESRAGKRAAEAVRRGLL